MNSNRFMTTALPVVLASLVFGCSASDGGSGGARPASENTGIIVAALTSVPANVHCVRIAASGRTFVDVFKDVTPGTSTTIHLPALEPGNYFLDGNAYNAACSAVQFGSEAGSMETWLADAATVLVTVGQTSRVALHFFPLGAITVGVSFDSCADAGGNSSFCVGQGDASVAPD